MQKNQVDLVNVFQTVTQALAQNQQTLDQQDEYNHDHGTNMVQTFQTITSSLQQKRGKSDSAALAYAAKKLSKSSSSSGKLYAQGLSQAATQFKRKKVDSKGALDLLQTLIGGGQASPESQQAGGADLVGALLGQLSGGAQPTSSSSAQAGDDLMGSLLGQLTSDAQPKPAGSGQSGIDLLSSVLSGAAGNQAPSSSSGGGIDLEDILNAGLGFMQAKQQGGSTAQALMQAFMSASGMGSSTHRKESTSVVVNSFLQALSSAGK